jgi:hypothetical protein
MTTLATDTQDQSIIRHPKISYWSDLLQRPVFHSSNLQIYPNTVALLDEHPKLYVNFLNAQGDVLVQDETDWSPLLHHGLVRLGVRARDHEHEAMRFALALQQALLQNPLSAQGSFLDTLAHWAAHLPEAQTNPALAEISRAALSNAGPLWGDIYDRFASYFENILQQQRQALTNDLRYTPDEAEEILTQALAIALDLIFYVTYSRELGLMG